MPLIPRIFLVLAAGSLSSAIAPNPPAIVSITTKQIAPGVTLTQTLKASPPLLIDALVVDPSVSRNSVDPQPANGSLTNGTGDIRKGRESVAAFVSRTGVVAAVNGDYFPYTGDPLGLGICDGEIYSEPYKADDGTGRAAIGWLPSGRTIVGIPAMQARIAAADGWVLPITGIDRLTSTTDLSDVCLVTPRFGPTSGARGLGVEIAFTEANPAPLQAGRAISAVVTQVAVGSPLPLPVPDHGFVLVLPAGSPFTADAAADFRVGGRATVSIDLEDETPTAIGTLGGSWNRVRQALGGGPILLRQGKIVVDDASEHLGGVFSTAPHARTAVGQRPDGKMVLLTVDAGSSLSVGISLADLASMMQQLGASDAINLDGGGSTTMAVQGGVTVDYPSGAAFERPVADLLAVRQLQSDRLPAQQASPNDLKIDGVPDNPVIGQSYRLSVSSAAGTISGSDERLIWNGPVGECGFIAQNGIFHVTGAGRGTVLARIAGENISRDIVATPVLPPTPIAPEQSGDEAPSEHSAASPPSNGSDQGVNATDGAGTQPYRSAPR